MKQVSSEMKKLIAQGKKLAASIETEYNKLDYDGYKFFEIHHDNLRIQMDCAYEELSELETYASNPNKKFGNVTGKEAAILSIDTLKDTLVFCKAVIELQCQTKELPTPIFG